MSGDYSRFTDRPRRRYSGVLMQQGRVQLDADWNEHVGIARRRWEVQAEDTFGRSAVPRATTPGGFKIDTATLAGKPDLTIGAGRIYVDGKLAELFADETVTVKGKAVAVSYLQQPFYPDPPPLPTATGYVVYLDAWDREVTWIEDPDILEKALGGPDTATRIQTVWQVKVDGRAAGDVRCGAPLPQPSGGRLSTRAVAPPPSDDPCILSPAGGYRGLENRLYRVEIHLGGGLGAARFKWSRDNASVVSAVTGIGTSGTASQLVVNRIGRDAVLRFATGNWVEVTDDVRELMGEPGEMAKVAKVDELTRTITLDRTVPATGHRAFGANAQELADRHTRLRRWDQTQGVDADGLLTQAAGSWISLGDGVEIQLSQAGTAPLATGDHWQFAARTVDGSVEVLDQAEPRGIRHHYCQLAAVTFDGTTQQAHDCRHLWPNVCGCCCVAEVGDGVTSHGDFDDLVAAVEELSWRIPAGTPILICLLPGTHVLKGPVLLVRDHLTIRGCRRAARVNAPPDPRAFVPSFWLAGEATALEDLYVVTTASARNAPVILCSGAGQRLAGNEIETAGAAAIWSYKTVNLEVAANRLSQRAPDAGNPSAGLLVLEIETVGARVAGNEIGPGLNDGVVLGFDDLEDVLVRGNHIFDLQGSGVTSRAEFRAQPGKLFSGLPIAAPQAERRQPIHPTHVPVPKRLDGLRIEGNTITGCVGPRAPKLADGLPHGAIVLASVAHVEIAGNRIEGNGTTAPAATPVAGIYVAGCQGLIVRDNVVVDNGLEPDGKPIPQPQGGILAVDLSVVVDGFDPPPTSSPLAPPAAPAPPRPTKFLRTDGWPAAAVHDNLVVAPRGHALRLVGIGPMHVTDNQLTARELYGHHLDPNDVDQPPEAWIGAVFVFNAGMTGYLAESLRTGGFQTSNDPDAIQMIDFTPSGKVEFNNNQVVLDLANHPAELALAATVIATLDDLAFADNQTEVRVNFDPKSDTGVPCDVIAVGATTRANGNGLVEHLAFTNVSLLAAAFDMATAGFNQGTHCILVESRRPPFDQFNYGPQCSRDFSKLRLLSK
jgi:Family of unknown function (DUF6519)